MEEPSIVSLSFGRPMLLKQNATWHHHLKLYYHFSIGISSKTPKGLSSFCGRSSYIWNTPIESIIKEPSNVVDSNGKVRHGFVLSRDLVEKLKKWVSFKCKSIYGLELQSLQTSTFVATCSLMWVCRVQSEETNNASTNPNNDETWKLPCSSHCITQEGHANRRKCYN